MEAGSGNKGCIHIQFSSPNDFAPKFMISAIQSFYTSDSDCATFRYISRLRHSDDKSHISSKHQHCSAAFVRQREPSNNGIRAHSRKHFSSIYPRSHLLIFVTLLSSYIFVGSGSPATQYLATVDKLLPQTQRNLTVNDFIPQYMSEEYKNGISYSYEPNQPDFHRRIYRSDGRRKRRYNRLYQDSYRQSNPTPGHWSISSKWFRRLLDNSMLRQRDLFSSKKGSIKPPGILVSEKKREEILRFSEQTVHHFRLRIDPRHVAFFVYQWEIYRLRLLAELRQKHVNLIQERKYRQKQMSEKIREEAEANARRISKAKTFDEFKQVIFGSNSAEVKTTAKGKFKMPIEAVIGPRIEHPVPEQPEIISATSSKLQFPKASGGGVMVKISRSTRDIKPEDYETKTVPVENAGLEYEEQEPADEIPQASEEELKAAFESRTNFNQTGCIPERRTLCTSSLLGLRPEESLNIVPPGFHVQRCGDSVEHTTCPTLSNHDEEYPTSLFYQYQDKMDVCETLLDRRHPSCYCLSPDQECLPTKVTTKMQPVAYPTRQGYWSTDLIVVTEHLACSCQPRCQNRMCAAPLKLRLSTTSHCSCVCEPNDTRCQKLLEGEEQFQPDELPVPLSGSFILPPCRFGSMDEYHLFHRRCPRRLSTLHEGERLG
ncbi:hypothetical protein CSKR_110137 [Clonorchis sinensis]|uniref:Uncharacterized protein n=2 Tax=Clonorchis sinensis TaxID=79923 RepID=A0A8T1MPA6_CLOSI|nr:hypothetical protein CSKR_110137 [Clonorchis sinensis]GAA54574.1 hypothetical protein CLF_103976 [Clonorchis sinensis]